MKKFVAFFVAIIGLSSVASVTNILDIAALTACGTGKVNGWVVNGIDSYADKLSIRLNRGEEYVESPDFGIDIRQVVMLVKSSSAAGRKLRFCPCIDGDYPEDAMTYINYSPNKDTYVPRIVDLSHGPVCSKFKLQLQDDGSATGWGICQLAVVTDTAMHCASPEQVQTDSVTAHSATLSWAHNVFVASNLVVISTVTNTPATLGVKSDYDFLLCQNALLSDSLEKSLDLKLKYPEFSAYKIYYPALSGGQIRVSTGSENGRLTHSGYADYSKLQLEISAKRYAGDTNCKKIYAYYVDDTQKTNTIGTIDIGDDFTTGRIPLAGTPGGVAINLGNLDGYKSNRRFIVERVTFLEEKTAAKSESVVVKSAVVAGDSFHAIRLGRGETYTATITAIDPNGKLADSSTAVTFTTAARDGGMMLRYR